MKQISVKELLNPLELFTPESPIAKVIGSLRDSGSNEAFAEESDRTAVVTLRDILNVKDITTTKVSKIMSYIHRLNSNNTVEDAASLMFEYRIRSLPVYENSKLLGQINAISILKRLMDSKQSGKVGSLMTPDPITVEKNDNAAKARNIMIRRKIDQVPILDGGKKLHGVVTSSEIVFNMVPQPDKEFEGYRFDVPVDDYSSEVTVSNEISDSLNDVFTNMAKNRSQYSILTNMDEIQGIITYRDFMRMLSHAPDDGSNSVPMYIIGLPEDPFEAEASREKFTRIVQLLRKSEPKLTEARAIIKSGEVKGARRQKYEVQIFVSTPYRHLNYKATGYELPEVFDEISRWSKRLVAKSDGDSRRRRVRARADPGEPE
jgi:CBS domain-containing protein